jgi:hypothetical protein
VSKKEETIIRGFKGFNRQWKCDDYQFKVGESFKHDGAVELCQSGFHLCEHPLDVFGYYAPGESVFAEVEAHGETKKATDDTKVVCSEIHIKAEVSFHAMVQAAVKFVFDRAKWTEKNTVEGEGEAAKVQTNSGAASATGYRGAASATGYSGAASATGDSGAASATGDRGAASATGYSGAASATGYRGAASATGDRGAASATGKYSVACGLGAECKAKASLGCGIVLAEREWINGDGWKIKDIQAAVVDGKKIKADTFYMLKDGKFVEVN